MSDLDIRSVLSPELRSDLRKLGHANSKNRLQVARLLKKYILEMDEGEQFVNQVYADAAIEYQDAAPRTIRGWVEAINCFEDDVIDYHITNGLPFEMFVVAKRLYNEYTEMDAVALSLHTGERATSPEVVLEKAYMGSADGDRNMTVSEVVSLFHGPLYDDDYTRVTKYFAHLKSLIPTRYHAKFEIIVRTVRSWIK